MVWSVNAVDTPLRVSDVSRNERRDGIIGCNAVEPDACVTKNVLDVALHATQLFAERLQVVSNEGPALLRR
jgi:hypothetical protein